MFGSIHDLCKIVLPIIQLSLVVVIALSVAQDTPTSNI